MKVYRVGTYYTSKDRGYAETMREVVMLSGADPGEPVEVEIPKEQWEQMRPTVISVEMT